MQNMFHVWLCFSGSSLVAGANLLPSLPPSGKSWKLTIGGFWKTTFILRKPGSSTSIIVGQRVHNPDPELSTWKLECHAQSFLARGLTRSLLRQAAIGRLCVGSLREAVSHYGEGGRKGGEGRGGREEGEGRGGEGRGGEGRGGGRGRGREGRGKRK